MDEDQPGICGPGSYNNFCDIACGSLFELNLPDENGVMTQYEIDPSIPLNRDSFKVKFNFDITNFDSIGPAYLTIF